MPASFFLQSDPTSIELSYCRDTGSKKEKKRVIELASIIGIRPTPKIGSADNIFAIETKERKYVLKAADIHIKNIWLAKLCEYCGQGERMTCDIMRVYSGWVSCLFGIGKHPTIINENFDN